MEDSAADPSSGPNPQTRENVRPLSAAYCSFLASSALLPGVAHATCPEQLPPITVCSQVTGQPLPWGPLGPVGLVLAAVTLGGAFRDEKDSQDAQASKQRKLNAAASAFLLCLAATPRTPAGALCTALLGILAPFIGTASRSTPVVLQVLLWAVLAVVVWKVAGIDSLGAA